MNKEFHYEKKGTLGVSLMSLNYVGYPHEIISFSPQINIETRQESVSKGTVTDDKESTTTTVSSGNTSSSFKKQGNGGGSVSYSPHTGAYSQS